MTSTSLVVVTRDDSGNIVSFVDEAGKNLSLSNMIADLGNPKGTAVPSAPLFLRVNEGMTLSLDVAAGSTGAAVDSTTKTGTVLTTTNLAVGKRTLPAVSGVTYYMVYCTSGSIYATVGDAVLGALTTKRNPNTAAMIGDSIANLYSADTGFISNINARGYIGWWLALSGQPFDIIGNYTVGGSRYVRGGNLPLISSQIDSAIASGAGWLLMEGGINDITDGTITLAELQASQTTVYTKALAAGMRIIWCTIMPLTNPTSTYGVREQSMIMQHNDWIRKQGRLANGGITIWDTYAGLVDPFNASGNATASGQVDGIHPTNRGAYNMGKRGVLDLASVVPAYPRLLCSNVDSKTFSANSTNLIDNGLFVNGTTTATNFGSGGNATLNKSLVARADGFGNNQRMACTFANSGDIAILNSISMLGLVTPGKTYELLCELTLTSPVNIRALQASIVVIGGSGSQSANWMPDDATYQLFQEGFTAVAKATLTLRADLGVLTTFKISVSAVAGAASASCTFDTGRMSLREIAP